MTQPMKFDRNPVPEPYAKTIERFGVEGGFISASEKDSPWVPFGDNAAIRHLTFDVRTNSYCNILWVKSPGIIGTHKHQGAVSAMCLEGSVYYLEHDWVARPGDFFTEAPGTAHTLVSDDPNGMKAIFWMQGASEFYNEKGELDQTLNVFWFIEHYVTYCEENNLPINQNLFI
ncbi:2,4'-dihydroxyacetophenone dioxygenase family protein [Emcibacter nanhaiensis]|uniref:tRNA modification GTPase n=1 Tax=Emcibacter nanhaiensis TaxID=1505037 RepID=A0A501PAJ5_9PROT|nr:2,4'-dihydroxyacetophenone dioxygenase family protein [Emcibacter nanhaiensis]TPD57373.1 tRNA modification GTPase [Emcibacter nanhaiensis]